MRFVLMSISLLACGGGENTPAVAPKPATVPVKAPAQAASAEVVGPDGPASIVVPPIAGVPADEPTVLIGQKVWEARGCGGCHKYGEKLVGPDLKGLLSRRTIPWVERMILFPEEMTKKDPEAKKMFGQTMVQMPKQGVTDSEIIPLLAYIKSQGG